MSPRPASRRRAAGRALATALFLASGLPFAAPMAGQEGAPPPFPAAADPVAAAKAVVRGYLEDVLSAGRLDLVETYVGEHYADRTPGADSDLEGPALVKRSQERLRAKFPEVRYAIEQLVAEGNLVAARYVVKAAYQPRRPGQAPPAPKETTINGITFFRVEGGKIQESWTINDQLELFQQLGYALRPPASELAPSSPPGSP